MVSGRSYYVMVGCEYSGLVKVMLPGVYDVMIIYSGLLKVVINLRTLW